MCYTGTAALLASCTGCGSLHLLRALGGTRILQAAAPTATPYFRHWRRSLPLPFAVRHREDLLLQKSSFSGSCLIHSTEWFSELVREHDHLQCRQHLIAAEAASTAYHKIIRFATKTPRPPPLDKPGKIHYTTNRKGADCNGQLPYPFVKRD